LQLVSAAQAWYYFCHQKDKWPVKSMVAAVLVFDTIHQCLIVHTVYVYVITNWGNPVYLERILYLFSTKVEVLFNGLTALVVQSFLAIRLWRFSGRKSLVAGFIGALVLGEFGLYNSFVLHMTTFVELAKLKYLSILVNALAAAGDLTIAAGLCINLHLSRTGLSRSNAMINMLILFSVNTGALTCLCAVASLISIVCAGDTFLYISFFFCIGRLYTNSLLATLNGRKMIRSAGSAAGTTNYDATPFVALQTFPTTSPRVSCIFFIILFPPAEATSYTLLLPAHDKHINQPRHQPMRGRPKKDRGA
ncbi:hypothetical protein HYPSUDRAFT_139786, partial [Hypholoma sublateritium FD-334 SS-4]